jgi:hypothetical protein
MCLMIALSFDLPGSWGLRPQSGGALVVRDRRPDTLTLASLATVRSVADGTHQARPLLQRVLAPGLALLGRRSSYSCYIWRVILWRVILCRRGK